jgi:uncharacterized radical SAM superfamily Fe-S cluster-containing enzyme
MRKSTDPPPTFREIGVKLGMKEATACKHYHQAQDRLCVPDNPMRKRPRQYNKMLEYRDPEKAAKAIDAITEPLQSNLSEVARKCDMPPRVAEDLDKRLQRDYQPVYNDVKRIKDDVFIKALEHNAMAALESITPEKLEKTNAYQATLIAAISLDKRLLIEGRPTQNISLTVEDRRSLKDLMAEIVTIAERRGYMKEINPATNQVRLADRENAPIDVLLHQSSKKMMQPIDHEDD